MNTTAADARRAANVARRRREVALERFVASGDRADLCDAMLAQATLRAAGRKAIQ